MEQLIFIDKREEQAASDEIRLSKQFNPSIDFPMEGGAISVIDATLNNNFHKIDSSTHVFELECRGPTGDPYDPYVQHIEAMTSADHSERSIIMALNSVLLPLDSTYPLRARTVDVTGVVVTSGDRVYTQIYAQQRFDIDWADSLAYLLGFTGIETTTDGGGGYRYLTSSRPINMAGCLPSIYTTSTFRYLIPENTLRLYHLRSNKEYHYHTMSCGSTQPIHIL